MFIDDDLKTALFKKLILEPSVNQDYILDKLISKVSHDELSCYMYYLSTNTTINIFHEGEIVKFKADNSSSSYNIDILTDLGLYEDGYLFGIVKKTPSYASTHNPDYGYVTVDVFNHDDNKDIVFKQKNIPTYKLLKTDKILTDIIPELGNNDLPF